MLRDQDLKNWNLPESKVEPGNGAKKLLHLLWRRELLQLKIPHKSFKLAFMVLPHSDIHGHLMSFCLKIWL